LSTNVEVLSKVTTIAGEYDCTAVLPKCDLAELNTILWGTEALLRVVTTTGEYNCAAVYPNVV
jgi:hypothetical protein